MASALLAGQHRKQTNRKNTKRFILYDGSEQSNWLPVTWKCYVTMCYFRTETIDCMRIYRLLRIKQFRCDDIFWKPNLISLQWIYKKENWVHTIGCAFAFGCRVLKSFGWKWFFENFMHIKLIISNKIAGKKNYNKNISTAKEYKPKIKKKFNRNTNKQTWLSHLHADSENCYFAEKITHTQNPNKQ